MSYDIYQILENLDAAQRSVKQLPALFKPKDTSPQLSGPYPGQNATRGYLVGEGEDNNVNPMAQAVTRRIVNQHPEWITRYGVEFLMQAIEDVTEGETDWEEIGSSDVSAYVHYVKDLLDDRIGSREEMDDRRPFAENIHTSQFSTKEEAVRYAKEKIKSFRDPEDGIEVWAMPDSGFNVVHTMNYPGREAVKARGGKKLGTIGSRQKNVAESATTEDVVSTVKKKLGDYLQDVATAIKKDSDLMDKLPQATDDIKAVKTMKTADGHEIKIMGNEDDGFRVSIKNKNSNSKFANLDEAVLAVEMYCARRQQAVESADYLEEKRS